MNTDFGAGDWPAAGDLQLTFNEPGSRWKWSLKFTRANPWRDIAHGGASLPRDVSIDEGASCGVVRQHRGIKA